MQMKFKPTQLHPLIPKPTPKPTQLHPSDLDLTPPPGSRVAYCNGATGNEWNISIIKKQVSTNSNHDAKFQIVTPFTFINITFQC